MRALGLEGERLDQAVAHAQLLPISRQQETQRAWSYPLEDLLPAGIHLNEQAQNLAREFWIPEDCIARQWSHLKNVHQLLYTLQRDPDNPSPLWLALHKPFKSQFPSIHGSGASFALLCDYYQDEKAKILALIAETPGCRQSQRKTEQQAWRRAKLRRNRETGNTGFLPKRLWSVGAWLDGDEPIPDHVITIDPGFRSPLTLRSFVVTEIDGVKFTTTNKGRLTAAAARRVRKRNAQGLQAIPSRDTTQIEDSDLLFTDRISSRKYLRRSKRNAKQQQKFDGAICRGVRQMLNRPKFSRDVSGRLYIKEEDVDDIISPKQQDVMLIVGASSSSFTAEAQGLILKLSQCFPNWKVRFVNEYLTPQLLPESHLLGKFS